MGITLAAVECAEAKAVYVAVSSCGAGGGQQVSAQQLLELHSCISRMTKRSAGHCCTREEWSSEITRSGTMSSTSEKINLLRSQSKQPGSGCVEVVGESVGESIGLFVGETVGASVGLAVGESVGLAVGASIDGPIASEA